MKSTRSQKNSAILQMLICATLWSTGGILIKMIPWNPFVIAGCRSVVAAAVLALYIKLGGLPFMLNKKTILAGLFMSLTCVSFVAANKLTTAANAIVLQFTSPVFIIVFSVLFFKKKFVRADILAVLFSMIGISLFFFDRLTAGKLFGNCVAIFAGMCMSWMFMLIGASNTRERINSILIAQIITIMIALPFFILYPPELTTKPAVSTLILGVLQLALPYILFAKASEYCPPLACSLLGALEPLLNPVWVFLFDGEAPGIFALAGGAIVIATVTLWCLKGDQSGRPQAAGESI